MYPYNFVYCDIFGSFLSFASSVRSDYLEIDDYINKNINLLIHIDTFIHFLLKMCIDKYIHNFSFLSIHLSYFNNSMYVLIDLYIYTNTSIDVSIDIFRCLFLDTLFIFRSIVYMSISMLHFVDVCLYIYR